MIPLEYQSDLRALMADGLQFGIVPESGSSRTVPTSFMSYKVMIYKEKKLVKKQVHNKQINWKGVISAARKFR